MYSGPNDRIRPALTGAAVTGCRCWGVPTWCSSSGPNTTPKAPEDPPWTCTAGALGAQPAAHPDLVLAVYSDALVPAAVGPEPAPRHPLAGRGGDLTDLLG